MLLDVFSEVPMQGNQLAVFLDANGLSDAEMQALARELNLSETTFCFPEAEKKAQVQRGTAPIRVRIFTVEEELPFAGHPTLGTAAALRSAVPELRDADTVVLRLRAGDVPVRFEGSTSMLRKAAVSAAGSRDTGESGIPFGQAIWAEMEQPLPLFGEWHEPEPMAAALGLPLEDLHPAMPAQTVSTGIPFVIVPLRSLEALQRLQVPRGAAERYLETAYARFFYVVAPEPGGGPTQWRARMQFYGREDPATGSAAGCATAYLVRHGFAPAGTQIVIRQGVEMGRASTLFGNAVLWERTDGGTGSDPQGRKWNAGSYVRVGGSTIPVASGRFFLS